VTDQPTAPASTAALASGLPLVKGRCPACNATSLFLGDGGYVTCARLDCPQPDAASTLLERAPDNLRTTPDNPAASNNETDNNRRALACNAIAPVLRRNGQWLPLNVRLAIADEVLAALDGPADTTPPAPGQATVTIRIHAPSDENADQWATTIRDLVTAEHGQDMRLDIRITPPLADACRPVQVDGETIRVHGARPLTGLELGYAAQIVAAAQRKLAAEPPVVRDDDGTESALTRRIRAEQRGLVLPAVEPPDDSEPPVPCPACTRARSRGFTVDALAHPGCADALADREARP
jgi:hypothetical protein